jgi:phenylalanyl-tRNA synthetase alpha chain
MWLEIGGCGTLRPAMLREAGYDPQAVSGYAFGLGLERLAMVRYGIDDQRKLWRAPHVKT